MLVYEYVIHVSNKDDIFHFTLCHYIDMMSRYFIPLPLAKTMKLCQRAESTLLSHQRTLTGRATAVGQGGRC